MFERTMYVIAVRDLKTSADYYRKVLGFEIHEIGDSAGGFLPGKGAG